MDDSIKILFLAADPSDLTRTRLSAEYQVILDELERGRWADRFALKPVFSAQVRDMTRAIRNFRPHIIHFAGHGSVDGELVFEDPKEEANRVTPENLEEIFAGLAGRVDCVILNACYSEKQAAMMSKYIPYIAGMKGPVTDQAAICFARGFYQSLSANGHLEGAFEDARALLRAEGFSDSAEPALKIAPGAGKPLAGPWVDRVGSKFPTTQVARANRSQAGASPAGMQKGFQAGVIGKDVNAGRDVRITGDSIYAEGVTAGQDVELNGKYSGSGNWQSPGEDPG